jgi:hypothetical protein
MDTFLKCSQILLVKILASWPHQNSGGCLMTMDDVHVVLCKNKIVIFEFYCNLYNCIVIEKNFIRILVLVLSNSRVVAEIFEIIFFLKM